jgi:hypothetical protein
MKAKFLSAVFFSCMVFSPAVLSPMNSLAGDAAAGLVVQGDIVVAVHQALAGDFSSLDEVCELSTDGRSDIKMIS